MTDHLRKLQIKPGMRLLVQHAPEGFPAEPAEPPADAVLLFAHTRQQLEERLPGAVRALRPGGLLWLAYPKKSSGVPSDLTRDDGWAGVRQAWDPVRSISLDDTWSALRFVPRSEGDPIDALFSRRPEHRPLFEELRRRVEELGPDVRVEPRKSYVGFARKKQFAVAAPTPGGLQIGLRLTHPRLQPSAGFGSGSITSRTTVQKLDEDVLAWIREAYENA